MSAGSILNEILKAFMDLARPSIIILWHLTVNYGLNPRYSYLEFINANTAFLTFYKYLFNSIYSDIIVTIMIFSAISMLVYNSFIKPYPATRFIIKMLVSSILFVESYKISMLFLKVSLVFYNNIYLLKPDWYNIGFSGLSPENALMSILLNGSFMLAIVLLFGILIIRQALLLFFILFMPLASILFMIPGSEKHIIKFYRIFFEVSFFPFFTLIILYLIGMFNNPYLDIGLIYVAATAPLFFVTEIYRYFQGSFNFLETDSIMSGISSNMDGISPEALLNGDSDIGMAITDTSGIGIPGIIDSNGDIH